MSATILLAEDDRILRKAGEATLKKKGYTVIAAVDGEDALAKAREHKPDLILLDVIMPKLQGFEVLASLKRDSSTRDIPVIMLSNLQEESDIRKAADAGALGYLVKSNVQLDTLTAKGAEILNRPRLPLRPPSGGRSPAG
jgi:CheY-like chemotaxis protein